MRAGPTIISKCVHDRGVTLKHGSTKDEPVLAYFHSDDGSHCKHTVPNIMCRHERETSYVGGTYDERFSSGVFGGTWVHTDDGSRC